MLNGWWQGPELATAIADVECGLVFDDGPRVQRLNEVSGVAARIVAVDDRLRLKEALIHVIDTGTADGALPMLTGDHHATIL
ncbi:hypothetical protein ABTK76_19585, partial [Acinetobacter baumannii]